MAVLFELAEAIVEQHQKSEPMVFIRWLPFVQAQTVQQGL